MTYYSNELYHYGVKGMKWGVRRYENKDGTLTSAGKKRYFGLGQTKYNENYSLEQQRRDERVYGRGGVKRISRDMDAGDSISAARSREADRIAQARKSATIAGQVGRTVGGLAAFALSSKAIDIVNASTGFKYSSILSDPSARLIIGAGMSSVATQIGAYGGQSLAMLAYGYSPSKYR